MCGRVTITVPREELSKYLYDYFSINDNDILDYNPSYNVAPSQNVLSIISDGSKYRVGHLKWGFVPEYTKDEKSFTMINTRSETIDTLPTFRNSFINKRCIIPVDSFYEWKKVQNSKQPVRIMMKDKSIFLLAGIWSTFIREDNSKLFTFSIVTTVANDLMKDIHNRMPVILNHEETKLWLDPRNKDINNLKKLLLPYDDNKMITYPVSSEVNSPKNNYESLIKEIKI